ncbi:helix-turn-helix transcriptional regulator [Rossellomorea marisflavi]|nr:helix-turn-helix transcriptional regulator [Rossellomorea marisflavi]
MLNNLKAEMARKNIKGKDVAQFLGVRQATIYDKLNGHYGFSFYEALAIKNCFFPEYDLEYLFKQDNEVRENATT